MAATALEVKDISSRLLVIPSARKKPPVSANEMAAFNARLAPIEMSTPTVHLLVPGLQKTPILPVTGGKPENNSEPMISIARQQGSSIDIPNYVLPGAYALFGLSLSLCTLLTPEYVVTCMHILCPAWTATLLLHALADGDLTWAWLGGITGALLPFVLLLRDPLFVCFYLVVFAVFATGKFWQSMRGPPFVLVCVCLFGLLTSCVLSVFADHPRAQLSIAAVFSLGSAIVSSFSRFGKLHLTLA